MSPRIVCVLAVARTGTGAVIDTLAEFDGLFVKDEIFHKRAVLGLEEECAALSQAAGIHATSIEDPALISWVQSHPSRVIDFLVEKAAGRCLVFKLFPHHLDGAYPDEVFRRDDIAFILVWRKMIDSYISVEKARAIGEWKNVETSTMAVRLDPRKFMNHFLSWSRWYRYSQNAIARYQRPIRHLSYQDDVSSLHLDQKISTVLAELGVRAGNATRVKSVRPKQDYETDYARKVANWPDFMSALRAAGLHEIAFKERGLEVDVRSKT